MRSGLGAAWGGALLGIFVAACAPAQLRQGGGTVEGKITPREVASRSGVAVELVGHGSGRYRTFCDAEGGFRFDGVAVDEYEVRVIGDAGTVLQRSFVAVRDESTPVNVELALASRTHPASGTNSRTVSIEQLRHSPPKKAAKDFHKSEELIAEGHYPDAIAHLEKAVTADPAFAKAYANLAACYGSLHQFDKAVSYARKAVEVDPGLPAAQMNLAHLLLALKEYPDAEAAARKALQLDGGSEQGHYFLALALKGQARFSDALDHFVRAVPSIPVARLQAADLLARSGRNGQAAGQLRAYLDTPGTRHRTEVEAWLARLKQ